MANTGAHANASTVCTATSTELNIQDNFALDDYEGDWDGYEPDEDYFICAERDIICEGDYLASVARGEPNYHLLCLALGRFFAQAEQPNVLGWDIRPQWAIKACLELYEHSQISVRPVAQKKKGPAPDPFIERLLERVADYMTDPELEPEELPAGEKVSVRWAIKSALAEANREATEVNILKAYRYWAKDKSHRLVRAFKRWRNRCRQRHGMCRENTAI